MKTTRDLRKYSPNRIYKTRLEDLLRININEVVKKGYWYQRVSVGGVEAVIELEPVEREGRSILVLRVNGVEQPQHWRLSSRRISGSLQHGGFIPSGSEAWYVVGQDFIRFAHLFINLDAGTIGTRA